MIASSLVLSCSIRENCMLHCAIRNSRHIAQCIYVHIRSRVGKKDIPQHYNRITKIGSARFLARISARMTNPDVALNRQIT